jgi:opacity protein-like surface antigen
LFREEQRMRRDIEKLLFTACLVAICVVLLVPCAYGEDGGTRWGISLLGGWAANAEPELTHTALLPSVEFPMSRLWSVNVEGNLSHYAISGRKDIDLLGANVYLLVRPVSWGRGSWFALAGGGLGYATTNRETDNLVRREFAAVIEAGTGIEHKISEIFSLKVEYRFVHISSPYVNDRGINSHNFVMGVTWP